MRRPLTLAVLALSLFSFPALPQQAPPTGSIEGIVVRAGTEQPIANAQVTLSQVSSLPTRPAEYRPPQIVQAQILGTMAPVTTAADGKFTFKDLRPGTYRVAATADGFVRQEYGQRALTGSGRLLFLVAGESINGANIQLTPTGTISGRVLDEKGQPATRAPVQLLRASYNLQGKRYQSVGTASADDRGNYRIFGVTPGRYYLMAGTLRESSFLTGPSYSFGGFTWYSVMYYPNVSKLDEATEIELKAGGESSADMLLKRETQMFHIRGRVINSTGAPFPQDMMMRLGYSNFSSSGAANKPGSFNPATGTFDVSNVPPGEFTVGITHPATGLEASVPIHVTNADIDGLVLTLATGVTVEGKLTVEGHPISAVPNLGQLRLNMRYVAPTIMGLPGTSSISPDGSFQVRELREGEYRVQMNANVPGFYVKSIKYGDEDITGGTFKFNSGDPGSFEVVLKAGLQTITGTVTDSESHPAPGIAVVFIPAQRGRTDLFRIAHTDHTGKFTMTELAPGDYKVFSWEAVDNTAYIDPDFLKQYEQLGKAISVTESFNSSVDVKLIPAQ